MKPRVIPGKGAERVHLSSTTGPATTGRWLVINKYLLADWFQYVWVTVVLGILLCSYHLAQIYAFHPLLYITHSCNSQGDLSVFLGTLCHVSPFCVDASATSLVGPVFLLPALKQKSWNHPLITSIYVNHVWSSGETAGFGIKLLGFISESVY